MATDDILFFKSGYRAKRLSKHGLRYQNPRKPPSQIKWLKFESGYVPLRRHLYKTSIKVLVIRRFSFLIANLTDLSTLTSNSGMP